MNAHGETLRLTLAIVIALHLLLWERPRFEPGVDDAEALYLVRGVEMAGR